MISRYDYIIVGSGIAGLYTALLARQRGSVLILTKSDIDECNTRYAQGGIAAALGEDDSPELHLKDTLAAGAGLCDEEAVRILVEEAPDRIADLIRYGVPFDTQEGRIALTKEAAHSIPRILHAGGDATGEQIEISLSRVARASRIKVLEHCLVSDVLMDRGVACGVRALDSRTGIVAEYEGGAVVLATGGGGQLFKFNTNPDIATGDGIALAFRAGAEIIDMEFFQFHPTALRLPGVPPFLISEAVRGEGGILRNIHGRAFMIDYDPKKELAPRDVVARSVVAEMKKTNSDHVLLDVTHLPSHIVAARFPTIYRFCMEHGLDIAAAPIPVAPAAHYMMGGIRTNVWGETNISNLFACGETACTGVHGANRLASNSLLEVLVFSKRIVERTAEGGQAPPVASKSKAQQFPLRQWPRPRRTPGVSQGALQSLMWDNVGIIRSRESLERAAATLFAWGEGLGKPRDRSSYELANSVLAGRLMAEAALIREESRGAHYRSDFPGTSPEWLKHIVFRR